jgi:S1-C subfamily serine protease
MPSFRRTARVIALLLLAFITIPALADPADIAAASRSVVRVVIIQNDGSNAQLITHGSGFAVAPDLVVTNAHVVKRAAPGRSLIVGVVPAEGRSGYQARLVAYSPRNDLALLRSTARPRFRPSPCFRALRRTAPKSMPSAIRAMSIWRRACRWPIW